jgi:hypothetical protein
MHSASAASPTAANALWLSKIALAAAAGAPSLRRCLVTHPGRVLLYTAEDALPIVRKRLKCIAAAAGMALCALDIQVITA